MKKRFYLIYLLFFIISCGGNVKESPEDKAKNRKKHFEITQFDELPKKRGLFAEHYPSSNERRIDFFMKHIKDLGGCYVGVGTDQNLSFIAKAKSEFAWFMDFDPVIVRVNKIHIYFLSIASDYPEFRRLWDRKNKASSYELIKKRFEKDSDFDLIKQAWETGHQNYAGVHERLGEIDYMIRNFKLETFANNAEEYSYLHKMAKEGRLQALSGDLTGTVSFRGIADAAKKMECPIRIFYTSNAEEYFRYPENFRKNILALPTDSKGLLIRTMTSGTKHTFGFPDGEKYPDEYPFHYNIQPLENLKKWMSFQMYLSIISIMKGRTPLEKGFSILNKTPQECDYIESGDVTTKPPGAW